MLLLYRTSGMMSKLLLCIVCITNQLHAAFYYIGFICQNVVFLLLDEQLQTQYDIFYMLQIFPYERELMVYHANFLDFFYKCKQQWRYY